MTYWFVVGSGISSIFRLMSGTPTAFLHARSHDRCTGTGLKLVDERSHEVLIFSPFSVHVICRVLARAYAPPFVRAESHLAAALNTTDELGWC